MTTHCISVINFFFFACLASYLFDIIFALIVPAGNNSRAQFAGERVQCD